MSNNKMPSCCGEMFSMFMSDEKLQKTIKERFEKFSGSECADFFARMKPIWENKSKNNEEEKHEEQSKA